MEEFSLLSTALGDSPAVPISLHENDVFVQKWKEALAQCRNILIEADRMEIGRFSSPEALLEDLKTKLELQQIHIKNSFVSRAIANLKIPIVTLKKALDILFLAMRPSYLETILVWGLLYLTIKSSLGAEARWKELMITLTRTNGTLQRCVAYNELAGNEEFKDNILAMFIALIKFWASASRWMRENPIYNAAADYLTDSFRATIEEMEYATNVMEHCYSSRLAGKGQNRSLNRTNMAFKDTAQKTAENGIIFPHRDLPPNNVEIFIGREDILSDIHDALSPCEYPVTQHFTIWGLGGVGKTQCAQAYAKKYSKDYDAIFWVRAENEVSLNQSFSNIAVNLRLVSASTESSPSTSRDLVLSWLRSCNKKWLMIFDNVEDLDIILSSTPTSRGAVLYTTRSATVATNTRGIVKTKRQLKAFQDREDWTMFSSMLTGHHKLWPKDSPISEKEVEAANKLLLKLGGLPLAIKQVAALIRHKRMDVSRFLIWYEKEAGDLNNIPGVQGLRVDPDYPFGVQTVWNMSFMELQKRQNDGSSEAYSLLAILSLLSPDAIPMDMFKSKCPGFCFGGDESLLSLENPKKELLDLALVDATEDSLSMHRLVQTTFLPRIDSDALQMIFGVACSLLNSVFPKQLFGRPLIPKWPTCIIFAPHVQSLARRFAELRHRLSLVDVNFLEVLSNCAWYLHEIGSWNDCLEMARVAIEACPDKDSLIYSHLQNTLGCCAFELNDLDTAREGYESALFIRRRKLDKADEDLLCTLNNYANLQNGSGHPEEALELYAEVQAFREEMGEDTLVSLALTYCGTGQALVQLRRYEEAKYFYDKSFKIVKEKYGPKGHYVAHILYLYGNMELAKGDRLAALKYYQEGLDIYQETNPSHMLTACLFYKIGCIKHLEGEIQEARTTLEASLAISQHIKSEGNVARIARKLWPLLFGDSDTESRKRVKMMFDSWERKFLNDEPDLIVDAELDKSFDNLVCLFFR